MDCAVVDVTPSLLTQIEALERACFSVPWTREQLTAQLPDARHVFLAAVRGGDVLGYIGMLHVLDEGYVSNVAVAPDARRQGVGAALVAALIELAEALRLAFVTLEARASNDAAIRLYERFGFQPVGRRKHYYAKPDEDAVLMTRFWKGAGSGC